MIKSDSNQRLGDSLCFADAIFDKKAKFQGDSYLEFDHKLLPHTNTGKETIKVSFETIADHGVLFFHGQKPDSDGKGRDYLVLALVDGYLVFRFVFVSSGYSMFRLNWISDVHLSTAMSSEAVVQKSDLGPKSTTARCTL